MSKSPFKPGQRVFSMKGHGYGEIVSEGRNPGSVNTPVSYAVKWDIGGKEGMVSPGEIVPLDPLAELLTYAEAASNSGKPLPPIDPKKYGFNSPEEYWKRIRELAGVK